MPELQGEIVQAQVQLPAVQQTAADKFGDTTPEWAQVLREAEKLAAAPLTPAHLKANMRDLANVPEDDRRRVAWQQTVANCILVANQARRWGADVFAVAAETYVVGNKLGYQGKLLAAVVNAKGNLAQSLQVVYSTGKGDDLAAVVYGSREGPIPAEAYPFLDAYADAEDRAALRQLSRLGVMAIRISVGQAKTSNDMWRKDPEQKLWYSGATKWARRHAPELMIGILSDDDLQRIRDNEINDGRQAAQSRIAMVIPATLDASGVLSSTPPDATQDTPTDQDDQDEPTQPQEPATKEPEPVDVGIDVIETEYREQIAQATTPAHLAQIELHAANNPALKDRPERERILAAVDQARSAMSQEAAKSAKPTKPAKPQKPGALFDKRPSATQSGM